MNRSYEFYKRRYGFSEEVTNELFQTLVNVDKDVISEDKIRKNSHDLLRMCVCEDKLDTFKKLIRSSKSRRYFKSCL